MAKKKTIYPWFIWGLGAAFFFAGYFARVAPSVMASELIQSFHVNALSLGALSAVFYYAYVAMQVPVGALVDRFGPRRLLAAMAFLACLGCGILAIADSLTAAELARFFMGLGASFAFVGSLKVASIWFDASRFGLLAGITQALGMLGAAVGSGPLSVAVEHWGWRATTGMIGGIILLISLLIALFMRDYPKGANPKDFQVGSSKDLWSGFVQVIKQKQAWINAAFVGLLYAPTVIFGELWGASYLSRVYDFHIEIAASAISAIFIGWTIGGPIFGWISDKIKLRKPVMILSSLSSCAAMSLVLYVPHLSYVALLTLLFLYGISNTGLATGYAVAVEINSKRIAGISVGFANMASVIIGALMQPIVGWIIDLQTGAKLTHGIQSVTPHAFQIAMLVLPGCLIMACIFAIFVRETHCKSLVD